MRGTFVEGKLLKGDILVSKTNNTPAYPTPIIKIHQEEGFWGEGRPGFGPTRARLWTRDHTGPRALKQNKWIQTLRQLAEWETELALRLNDPPRPFFYWEPDSTSSAPWLSHEFSGLAWRGGEGGLAGHRIYPPPCKKKPVSALYTCGEWAYNDGGAITDLTVSSWVSRVARLGLVIIEHCQNTSKLQPSVR